MRNYLRSLFEQKRQEQLAPSSTQPHLIELKNVVKTYQAAIGREMQDKAANGELGSTAPATGAKPAKRRRWDAAPGEGAAAAATPTALGGAASTPSHGPRPRIGIALSASSANAGDVSVEKQAWHGRRL